MIQPEFYKLRRWVERKGCIVTWGNVVAGYNGQSCRDTMATETDAIERERQARACESLANDREPIPVKRKKLT